MTPLHYWLLAVFLSLAFAEAPSKPLSGLVEELANLHAQRDFPIERETQILRAAVGLGDSVISQLPDFIDKAEEPALPKRAVCRHPSAMQILANFGTGAFPTLRSLLKSEDNKRAACAIHALTYLDPLLRRQVLKEAWPLVITTPYRVDYYDLPLLFAGLSPAEWGWVLSQLKAGNSKLWGEVCNVLFVAERRGYSISEPLAGFLERKLQDKTHWKDRTFTMGCSLAVIRHPSAAPAVWNAFLTAVTKEKGLLKDTALAAILGLGSEIKYQYEPLRDFIKKTADGKTDPEITGIAKSLLVMEPELKRSVGSVSPD